QVGRLVIHHFLRLAPGRGVGQDSRQPLVHLADVVIFHVASARGGQHDMVVVVSVGIFQALAHGIAVDLVVDVAGDRVVIVIAQVDDGRGSQSAAAVGDAARLVGAPDRVEVTHGAGRGRLQVPVHATNVFVQVEELV